MDSVPSIDADSRSRLQAFFRHTAYFLWAGQELMQARQQQQQQQQQQQAAVGAAAAAPPGQ